MRNIGETAWQSMAGGSPAITGQTLAWTFATAWLTAVAAVFILPAIFAFGIAAGIVGWAARRKSGRPVVIEGEYRVLGTDTRKPA